MRVFPENRPLPTDLKLLLFIISFLIYYQCYCLSYRSLTVISVFVSRVVNMTEDDLNKSTSMHKAPTYPELIALVAQLRAQLEIEPQLTTEVAELRAQLTARDEARSTSHSRASLSRAEPAEYRVVPDLSRAVSIFSGEETPLQAEDWLEEVKGMVMVKTWPFRYVLQFVRIHATGPARDWYAGREFDDWDMFERKFRLTFVRSACASDREDEMRARKQSAGEGIISYMYTTET
jgi:hypothetical protein